MFKTITNKDEYIKHIDVSNYKMNDTNKIERNLFGKKVVLENDPWMWHLHLKVTNDCMCNCDFCIEKGLTCKESCENYLDRLDKILSEMESQNILYSVSVTGGEPLLFKDTDGLFDVLHSHDIKFLTMNTNAILLKKNSQYISKVDGLFDYIDISRHKIDDKFNSYIFHNKQIPTTHKLQDLKLSLDKTKLRLQCVITDDMEYSDLLSYMNSFYFADNFSFRRLMKTSEIHNVKYNDTESDKSYWNILENVYNDFYFIQQTIQDYYVYETWKYNNKNITFSYSDMNLLTSQEKIEDDSVCREFILHPDGTFSGSWDKNKKVILSNF